MGLTPLTTKGLAVVEQDVLIEKKKTKSILHGKKEGRRKISPTSRLSPNNLIWISRLSQKKSI